MLVDCVALVGVSAVKRTFDGVSAEGAIFEGVLGVDDGVAAAGGAAPGLTCSFNSPYSFHSSTSSRSYTCLVSMDVIDPKGR